MMVKTVLVFSYFDILLPPSELPATLPGQCSLSRQLFLHWAAATLKGLVEFQRKKIDLISPSYLTQKCWFQDFSLFILGVLGGEPELKVTYSRNVRM